MDRTITLDEAQSLIENSNESIPAYVDLPHLPVPLHWRVATEFVDCLSLDWSAELVGDLVYLYPPWRDGAQVTEKL